MPIHILAKNFEQYQVFRTQLAQAMTEEGVPFRYSDFIFINGPDSLRGFEKPWGYKVGSWSDNTWSNRADIDQILQEIAVRGSSIETDFIQVLL